MGGRSWALHRALSCHVQINTTTAIKQLRRSLHGQVGRRNFKEGPILGMASSTQVKSWTRVTTFIPRFVITLTWVARTSNTSISWWIQGARLCQRWWYPINLVSYKSHTRAVTGYVSRVMCVCVAAPFAPRLTLIGNKCSLFCVWWCLNVLLYLWLAQQLFYSCIVLFYQSCLSHPVHCKK